MSIQISTNGEILLDNHVTGLGLSQTRAGTVVFTLERAANRYKVHSMPHVRYSTAHDKPASGVAGKTQLENDVRALLS